MPKTMDELLTYAGIVDTMQVSPSGVSQIHRAKAERARANSVFCILLMSFVTSDLAVYLLAVLGAQPSERELNCCVALTEHRGE